jgi:hypothetical protein
MLKNDVALDQVIDRRCVIALPGRSIAAPRLVRSRFL